MGERDRVFISYRRSDRAASAALLRKALVERLGEHAVFQDVKGIDPGVAFPTELAKELSRAAVVLAVIGPDWLSASNEFNQRRIDFEDDWVRRELEAALSDESVLVIPVLVEDATLPPARALPRTLRELALRNAVELHNEMWDQSCSRLLDKVAEHVGGSTVTDPADLGDVPANSMGALGVARLREIVRSAVTEALEAAGLTGAADPFGGTSLARTLDELSRLLATSDADTLDHERQATLELLVSRIVGQSTVVASEHAADCFAESTELQTTTGRWLLFAVKGERPAQWERTYSGCLLLLPDSGGHISGGVILRGVEFDAEFARDDGIEHISHGTVVIEVGAPLGTVRSS